MSDVVKSTRLPQWKSSAGPVTAAPQQARPSWWLRRLLQRLQRAGISRIHLRWVDGAEFSLGVSLPGVAQPRVAINQRRAIRRGIRGGLLGWAEGYMAGDWDCDDLHALTDWAMANEQRLEQAFTGSPLSAWLHRLLHRLNANSKRGSRRNIAFHYDLGNDFYRLWLDPTMTYSSALFASPGQSLEQAQRNKYQTIANMLGVSPGDRVLEIGCGWGGMAEHLLQQHDVSWHGITLSQQQLLWCQQRLAGFAGRAEASLTDYRDLAEQQYDAIVSIEMLEAVGEEHWPQYFATLRRCLKPGGYAVIQVITIADERFAAYRQRADFIQRYIFPGGMLPSPTAMSEQIAAAGLHLVLEDGFGDDYARTLRYWHQAFNSQWPALQQQGFDERFRRMWNYYLAYCESGFRAGSIDVRFYLLRNP
ncbi:cyclopropane-fatty-acyl-phospholipid synthase [Pokkaliibacter sp. MBI-7]|uniref:cyclopropane-fatty-acyl-phospholipid synthase n=1 Tax=Pokkaliibacter sp. MBI-7 TaxID=3040600 RepID=UPI00244BCCFF|nr:cyclopropane-fatty-acyl-phospholipid synthase [Pokkaliibacter sp. MBI-7]MDH2433110.1 cyclopropane-fatty-acyl-phospholipid synthase [Pokkaliibacter sp. MBI-7]